MLLQLAHTKTEIFQQSQNLALECYRVTKLFPSEEKFAMVQQIRRAALSVYLNIAEGCSRKSVAERKRFFEISRGSIVEIDAVLDLSEELNYSKKNELENLGVLMQRTFGTLTKMI